MNKFILFATVSVVVVLLILQNNHVSNFLLVASGDGPRYKSGKENSENTVKEDLDSDSDFPAVLRSPFGKFVPVKIDKKRLVEQRKEIMKKNGFFTPEEYFSMSLRDLQKRAKTGDIYALIQLAQQYCYESDALQYEDGFDFNENSQKIGRQYFADAAINGYAKVTSLVIQMYDGDGDKVNAYAWQLFSQRMGDNYSSSLDLHDLNDDDINKAKVVATELSNQTLNHVPLQVSSR